MAKKNDFIELFGIQIEAGDICFSTSLTDIAKQIEELHSIVDKKKSEDAKKKPK